MSEKSIHRRDFIKITGLSTAALAFNGCMISKTTESSSFAKKSPGKRPPNILLIVSDDQGYKDLGCFGASEIKTPNLDRLAAGGVRLTNFYVTWPACTPSRGSLLTGRYPQRNGTYDMYRNYLVDNDHLYTPDEYEFSPENILGMDTREVLIPRVLKKAGYTSGIFGKWDLGQLHRFLPLQRGFDEFYGFTNTGIDYWTHERYGVHSMRRGNELSTEDKGAYATDLFRREALQFIKKHKDKPFFCYVPFNAPHGASNLNRPRPGVQAPLEYIRKHYGQYDPKDSNTKRAKRLRYMAAVTYMDETIGDMLDSLQEIGQADNTIVIFFSDNGGGGAADNKPLRGNKGDMFEGGIRVPAICRWPGAIPAGTVCNEFLTSMEIFPMLCRAAGTNPPKNVPLDGFDMTQVLAGKRKSSRKEMFWQRRSNKGARVGNFKWVESSRGSGLFDLSKDIGEKNDLSKEKPEVLASVKARFDAWKKQMAAAEPRRPFRDF
jgi:arylsulfatase A